MKCHFSMIKIHLFNTSTTQSPKVNTIEDTKKYKISVLRDLTILLESHTNRKKKKLNDTGSVGLKNFKTSIYQKDHKQLVLKSAENIIICHKLSLLKKDNTNYF